MTNPMDCPTPCTLIDMIQNVSVEHNRGIWFILSEKDEIFLSFNDLFNRALKKLHILKNKGVEPGDELIFQIDDNQTLLEYFWACILGGIIPVPVSVGNNDDHKLKLFIIWKTMQKPRLLTQQKVLTKLEEFADEYYILPLFEKMKSETFLVEDLESKYPGNAVETKIFNAKPGDTAYIQFTSGTTSPPKGVILTHRNIMANLEAIFTGSSMNSRDRLLSWMPLTHDMGLNCHLVPMWGKMDQFIIPTSLFIRRPNIWLQKASEHKASMLTTSNFGIKYTLSYYNPSMAREWDLSAVRVIFNGAEPVSVKFCDDFLAVMKTHSLHPNTMFTVYGMAEAGLAVTFPQPGREFSWVNLTRDSISIGNTVQRQLKPNGGIRFVKLGSPVQECKVRICDAEDRELPEETVGYIQIKGKNVTPGYYENQPSIEKAFSSDGWLKTGDIGFMENGQLIVTGREKNIITENGRNYYPHDIERVVEGIKGLENSELAACSVPNETLNSVDILLFVLFKRELHQFLPLAAEIKQKIWDVIGIEISEIIPVKKIPKTTSGKIQHYKLIEAYLCGEFTELIQEIRDLRQKTEEMAI